MILGIGIDMVDINRIEALMEKQGDAFSRRILTAYEQTYVANKGAASIAKRFAAKEATAKAMGTGIGEHAAFTDIEIRNEANGRPVLHFYGPAKEWMEARNATAHVSLSDEPPYAIAQVTIEAPSAQD